MRSQFTVRSNLMLSDEKQRERLALRSGRQDLLKYREEHFIPGDLLTQLGQEFPLRRLEKADYTERQRLEHAQYLSCLLCGKKCAGTCVTEPKARPVPRHDENQRWTASQAPGVSKSEERDDTLEIARGLIQDRREVSPKIAEPCALAEPKEAPTFTVAVPTPAPISETPTEVREVSEVPRAVEGRGHCGPPLSLQEYLEATQALQSLASGDSARWTAAAESLWRLLVELDERISPGGGTSRS